MSDDLLERMTRFERSHKRLRFLVALNLIALPVSLSTLFTGFASSRNGFAYADSIRVNTIVVVDSKGVERVRLGGNLPGEGRKKEGSEAAGILLFDAWGQERSGYVTFSPNGYVGLTLDTKHQQVALFAADTVDGASLKLWKGDRKVIMSLGNDGARFSAVRKNRLVGQMPTMTSQEEATLCKSLKDELKELAKPLPAKDVMAICTQYMTDAACQRCLRN
jgi:hypothetical protein